MSVLFVGPKGQCVCGNKKWRDKGHERILVHCDQKPSNICCEQEALRFFHLDSVTARASSGMFVTNEVIPNS